MPPQPPATLEISLEGLRADASLVDALARLALAGRRIDCRIVLRGASVELLELIELCGLGDMLGE